VGWELGRFGLSARRLTVRHGARVQLREKLPALVRAVGAAGQVVAWVCDPMHGNTECVAGIKTRRYDNIRAEVCARPLFALFASGPTHCSLLSYVLFCLAVFCLIMAHSGELRLWMHAAHTRPGGVALDLPLGLSGDPSPAQVEAFFDVHEELGTVPGGIHLEMTGDDVTECLGGGSDILEADLNSRYHTHCDPRLNAEQALEMAFYVASRLRRRARGLFPSFRLHACGPLHQAKCGAAPSLAWCLLSSGVVWEQFADVVLSRMPFLMGSMLCAGREQMGKAAAQPTSAFY
jgi:hypothetical protein